MRARVVPIAVARRIRRLREVARAFAVAHEVTSNAAAVVRLFARGKRRGEPVAVTIARAGRLTARGAARVRGMAR